MCDHSENSFFNILISCETESWFSGEKKDLSPALQILSKYGQGGGEQKNCDAYFEL